MRKLNLTSLLLGAALFMTMGTSTLSAEAMKCGAGKCGASMQAPAPKCGASMQAPAPKCGSSMQAPAPKCGSEKKDIPKVAGKCGTGKCS